MSAQPTRTWQKPSQLCETDESVKARYEQEKIRQEFDGEKGFDTAIRLRGDPFVEGLKTAAVSPRLRRQARRAWPALLTAVTLACVTRPSPADASEPAARGPTCDGGPCGTQKPPAPHATTAPAATPPALTLAAASSPATPLCDTHWDDGHDYVIHIDEQKDDARQLLPFNPNQPMTPYELRGARYLYREKGRIYRTVGRFQDEQDGEAMLRKVEGEMTHLYTSAYPPFLAKLGAYLASESPTCKVSQKSRTNRAIDSASWVLEKEGVLVAGSQSACSNGTLTKKLTVISCDGTKNLLTDSVEHVCDADRRVDTCIYTLEPGILLFEHEYTLSGATSFDLRVYDVRKKKRLYTQKGSYGPGLPGFEPDNNEPRTAVEDVDQDGIPELVSTLPKTRQRTSVRKWRQGQFVETRSP